MAKGTVWSEKHLAGKPPPAAGGFIRFLMTFLADLPDLYPVTEGLP